MPATLNPLKWSRRMPWLMVSKTANKSKRLEWIYYPYNRYSGSHQWHLSATSWSKTQLLRVQIIYFFRCPWVTTFLTTFPPKGKAGTTANVENVTESIFWRLKSMHHRHFLYIWNLLRKGKCRETRECDRQFQIHPCNQYLLHELSVGFQHTFRVICRGDFRFHTHSWH